MRSVLLSLMLGVVLMSSASPWETDSVKQIYDGRVLDEIEGIWQFPDDGAKLAITKRSETTFDIIILDSPDARVRPGTHIGVAELTAKAHTYDAKLQSSHLANKHVNKSTATLAVTPEGFLSFTPYSEGYGLSVGLGKTFRNILPLLVRVNVTKGKQPSGITGARKLFPLDTKSYKPCL